MPEPAKKCANALCKGYDPDVKLLKCAKCKETWYCGEACQKDDWTDHKWWCGPPKSYLLKVVLCPNEIKNPPITRTISIPALATFHDLHAAIQLAFDWSYTHTYDFKIKDPDPGPIPSPKVVEEITQRIKRKWTGGLQVRGPKLNLFRFVDPNPKNSDKPGHDLRSHPLCPDMPTTQPRLYSVFANQKMTYKDAVLEYEYDFENRWCHEILVLKRTVGNGRVCVCIDGEGHGAAENVGGAERWERLKEAYRAANPTQEQKESMRWYETQAKNGDPKGLGGGRDKFWDKEAVNVKLHRVFGGFYDPYSKAKQGLP